MGFQNTPYMGLPVPDISKEPGPQYATDINQCLRQLDQHNHGPGSGVPIGAQGLNIQSDLSFNINNAIAMRTVRFIATTATSGTDVGCLYMKGIDLYFNDGAANNIRITQSGGISTSATFIALIQTTAIVSVAGATPATSGFVRMNNNTDFLSWRNAANNADDRIYFDSSDNLQVIGPGPVAGVGGTGVQSWNFRFPDPGNSGKVITLTAPFGTSAYTLTLPSQPSTALAPVFISSSGSLTASGQITGGMMAGNNNIPGKYVQIGGFSGSATSAVYPVVGQAYNATSGLGLLRGQFYWDGGAIQITGGEGFGIVRTATGQYTVTFSQPFNDKPIIVNTAGIGLGGATNGIGPTSANLISFSTATGATGTDTDITHQMCFMAMGQRA